MKGISTSDSHPQLGIVAPPNSTGINIIVVGCGYGGLACAIECKRKGHRVTILEKIPEFKVLGDIVRVQPLPLPLWGAYGYDGHRAEIHEVIYNYALSIGVDIRFNHAVEEYFEDEENGKAGVVVNGEKYEADLVVAADGVKSQARHYILGYDDKPRASGYAIFRAWFDAEEQGVDKDPLTDYLCKNGDSFYGWIGRDVHFLASSTRGGKEISWVITRKDDFEISDSWSFAGKMEDVLAVVDGWDPRCAAILAKAPSCIDWKLIIHDPLPTWIGKSRRVMLIGDAAHPFLPTSQQGGSQAIEDGVTLAAALQLAGKDNIPLAVESWEKIRYLRVRRSQLMGEEVRNKWHRSKPEDRGESLDMPRPEWLFSFDAEAHTYKVFDQVSKEIKENGYQLPILPPELM
ncbi:hypothetical protein SERLADRAFT_442075 [Serpula lacrymans var. lacrymans S7.9]|uniref:FAD/NAD(P)-binding domain-containing protein n=1 Tax=Serpula lacrymans var. lacrymans (strain S7.9) TaxID=578457 RepID=F8P8I5_SERL9|nr:uncharacterized protein SERLADRAFT_442075 [Serpula lacrymans var. lacrymans S7.9]EGO20741.1 hypothetical protein SERLADRAFT_442075 [Serpula lacrymans var. lacrymans S7.9]